MKLADKLRERLLREEENGHGNEAAAAMLRRQIQSYEMMDVKEEPTETYLAGTQPSSPDARAADTA